MAKFGHGESRATREFGYLTNVEFDVYSPGPGQGKRVVIRLSTYRDNFGPADLWDMVPPIPGTGRVMETHGLEDGKCVTSLALNAPLDAAHAPDMLAAAKVIRDEFGQCLISARSMAILAAIQPA